MKLNLYRRLFSLILICVVVLPNLQFTNVQANAKASPLFASGNDSFGGAITINSDNFSDTGDITNDTEDGSDPEAIACGGPLYQTVWYEFTPASDGSLTLDMDGSSGNTTIVVVTGSPGSFIRSGLWNSSGSGWIYLLWFHQQFSCYFRYAVFHHDRLTRSRWKHFQFIQYVCKRSCSNRYPN